MKHFKELSSYITDAMSDIGYIVNINTYEVYYLNKQALSLLGNPTEEQWYKKPCYSLIQGFDKPCEFCNKHSLSETDYTTWSQYNNMFKCWLSLKSKKFNFNGEELKVEIGRNITSKEEEKVMISCMETLYSHHSQDEIIINLLKIFADFRSADRAYIFEVNKSKTGFTNTYEWCNEGIPSQKNDYSIVPFELVKNYIENLNFDESIISFNRSDYLDKKDLYSKLEKNNVDNFLIYPLFDDNNILGFFGVDNPSKNLSYVKPISTLSNFLVSILKEQALKEKISKLNFYDKTTGLKNRDSYNQVLTHLQNHAPNNLGILHVDIDGLKGLNDRYGSSFGDSMIKKVAASLKSQFSNNVYRIGGDEFIVLLTDVEKNNFEDKTLNFCEEIKNEEFLNVSVGHSWCAECKDIIKQIEITDSYRYTNKQLQILSSKSNNSKYNLVLSNNLNKEIRNNKFQVFLQPKVHLETGELQGAEALIRKMDEHGNYISPTSFIPFYEKEGIIPILDLYVFEISCKFLNTVKSNILNSNFKLSVNFSRVTLCEKNIVDKMVKIANENNVETSRLVIEVTESIDSIEVNDLLNFIHNLKTAGFLVALDDFGVGHSNLFILKEAPFNEVKLDRSLIEKINSEQKTFILIKHIISICKELDISISVAEGIETSEQAEILKELNCKVGQGYFFSKPMPINTFISKYFEK